MRTEKLEEIQKKIHFEYIDPKFAIGLWQEGEAFARQVIQLYIKSLSGLITNCHKALIKHDVEGIAFIIHQNKPNLIQLKASYLLSLLEKLKNNLEKVSQDLEVLEAIFVDIKTVAFKIQTELKHFL